MLTPRGKRGLEIAAATILGAGVYLGTLVARRVYPAGDNSILTHDLTGQYAGLFSYLRRAVFGPEGLLFSWQADLGMNFFPLAAYYLASPFNAIAVFVADRHLPEAIVAITAAKLATAAGCMAWYLRRTFPGPRPLVVAAAVTYASMSWALFQATNLMWLDALYLLPLVLLAIEWLLAGRAPLPLAVASAATMLVNYYSGLMVMLLAGLYFVVRYVSVRHRFELRDLASTGSRAVLAVGVGLLCAGVVIVPSLRAIGGRYTLPGAAVSSDVPLPWSELVASLFGGTMEDKLRGAPHLAVGTATLVFVLVFLVTRTIKRRERFAFAGLAAFVLASCQVPVLYLLWHGMEVPTSYPHRFGFVLSFLLVLLGYRAAAGASGWAAGATLAVSAGVALVAVAWVAGAQPGLMRGRVLTWTVLAVLAAAVVGVAYVLLRHRERVRRPLVAVLALVLLLDAAGAAALASTRLVRVDRAMWDHPGPAWREQLEAARPAQDEFFRADALAWRTPNDSLRFGNFALTHYSSITSGRVHRALHRFGLSEPLPFLRFNYQGSTLVTDALLGFRHVLSNRPLDRAGFELVREVPAERPPPYQEPLYAYENANALPVGFFLPPRTPLPENVKVPYEHLENLAGEEDLFTDVCPGRPVATGGDLVVGPAGAYVTRHPTAHQATLTWTCTVTGDRQLYLWHQSGIGTSDVRLDDGPAVLYPTTQERGIFDLGRRTDSTFTVTIATRGNRLAVPRPIVQGLDLPRFRRWVDGLRARSARQVHWSSSGLSVSVDDPKGGRFFLSVPHVAGWQAQVDGRDVPIRTTAGAFVGVDLEPGAHRIELAFRPPGLRAGLLSTAFGVASLALLALLALRRRPVRLSAPRTPRPYERELTTSRSNG